MTPLHFAASHVRLGTIRTLTLAGADVGARDQNGWTPLYWARCALDAKADEVRQLLEAGTGGRSAMGPVRALLRRVQARLSVMARLAALAGRITRRIGND